MRCYRPTAVGNGGSGHQHLDGCGRDALTESIRAKVHGIPIVITWDLEPALRFTGQVDAGEMTQPEIVHVTIERLWPHLGRDPRETYVQRVLQAANHILLAPGLTVPVMDGGATNKDRAGIE